MPPRTFSALPSVPWMRPVRSARRSAVSGYAARQAYERASAAADRLARRVRDLAECLDGMAE